MICAYIFAIVARICLHLAPQDDAITEIVNPLRAMTRPKPEARCARPRPWRRAQGSNVRAMGRTGRLVAIEGGEGAGKSTQAGLLAVAIGAELTREPGGSPVAERIRALLLDPSLGRLAPRAELHLMLAARAEHLSSRIEPALSGGRDVVVDRFAGSTLAYQGYGRGLSVAEVREACDLAAGGRWPELSVLLDIPLDLAERRWAADRAGSGPGPDRIEAEDREFHQRVGEGFRALAAADDAHWGVVDGSAPTDEVAAAVLAAVTERLGIKVAP
jgi:dTMP kinase